jgi:hypothetical protein
MAAYRRRLANRQAEIRGLDFLGETPEAERELVMCLIDTDREIRANFDRLERATVAVVDPGVSF